MTGKPRSRVYAVSLDGLTEAMVAAGSIQDAATALGASVRTLREAGWRAVSGPSAALASKQPGLPLYRSVAGPKPGRWTADRGEAAATAARSVLRAGRY